MSETEEAVAELAQWMALWDRVCTAADPDDSKEPPPWSEVRAAVLPGWRPEITAEFWTEYMHADLVYKVRDFLRTQSSLTPPIIMGETDE